VSDGISGALSFFDPDQSDRPTASIDRVHETVKFEGAGGITYSLTEDQLSVLKNAFSIFADTANTNSGTIRWNYSIADKSIDFVGFGETVTITAPVVIDDHHGGIVTQNIFVTIQGTNDRPTAVANSAAVAKGATLLASSISQGVLSNDLDPDANDHLIVSAVNGSSTKVGQVIPGQYGSVVIYGNGTYSYTADKGNLPAKIVPQDTFKYTAFDGHGGTMDSTLTVLVFNPGVNYLTGANTTLTGLSNSKNVLDGSAGGDILKGGSDVDILIGGNGDTLIGGAGSDTFVFRPGFGKNTVTDFSVNNDTVQLDKSLFTSVSDILAHTTTGPTGAIIHAGTESSIELLGVSLAQLQSHQADFHLV
jgi:VCBS repeat-containing protein